MKYKNIHTFLIFIGVILFCISGFFAIHFSFSQYQKIQYQIQEYPDIIFSPELAKWISIGNTNTFADFQWIELIQYIGSNIAGSRYLGFSHTMIETITGTNPYFIKPYEWALLLVPMRNSAAPLSEESKAHIEEAVKIGEQGFENLCKSPILQKIQNTEFYPQIFLDTSLQNFCPDASMLAYYLGFQYSELDEMAKSRYYYTIAGLHENAPTASQILAVLASPTHDQKKIAQKFLLMAASTPNTQENKQCIQTALEVFDMVQKSPTFSENWIENFETIEKSLTPVAEPKEGQEYCFPFFDRAAKQIYQAYITDIATNYPNAETGQDLIDAGAIDAIPQTQTQSGFFIRKMEYNWKFYK